MVTFKLDEEGNCERIMEKYFSNAGEMCPLVGPTVYMRNYVRGISQRHGWSCR